MVEGNALQEATVLVVEDERNLADLYASTLEQEYQVLVAYDGEEALELVDQTVDVVLLDRRMPGKSGDEVLAAIRDAGYGCRVVMVTAVDPDFDIVDMSFENYLTKPVEGEDLIDAVNEQLIYSTYDESVREYTRLRSKIDILRSEEPAWKLADDARFERLRLEADSTKEDIETLLADHEEAVSLPDDTV